MNLALFFEGTGQGVPLREEPDGGGVLSSSWIGMVFPCLKLRHEMIRLSGLDGRPSG